MSDSDCWWTDCTVGKITHHDYGTEEVIFAGFDEGWKKQMPIRLIFYSTGSIDIIRQSGSQFTEHMEQAEKILATRGLRIDKNGGKDVGMTGIYQCVVHI